MKTYQRDLSTFLGSTRLGHWVFVTPEIDKHALLAHARSKETEVRGWNLPFLSPDFCVLLYDGDSYLLEINEIRSTAGEARVFDAAPPMLPELAEPQQV